MWSVDIETELSLICRPRSTLIDWGLVTPIWWQNSCHHWFRYWFVIILVPAIAWTNDDILSIGTIETRTTRTPAFWGYPPPPNDYPYHWVILDPKSKEDKVKVTNFKNSPNFWILKRALHATHLLKLLDKMCKYEMDPMSIVEDTERTRFCPQTDGRTRWYQYTPLSTSLKRGV